MGSDVRRVHFLRAVVGHGMAMSMMLCNPLAPKRCRDRGQALPLTTTKVAEVSCKRCKAQLSREKHEPA